MRVIINIKGYSNSKTKIKQIYYEYSKVQYSIKEFLEETVLLTIKEYENNVLSQDLFKVLTSEEIEEKSSSGKISFNYHYNDKKLSKNKAFETAIQAFSDGLVVLFIDDNRYDNLEDIITLSETTNITFIRLTFLAGRMW